jgi:anti-sigma factor RsiW
MSDSPDRTHTALHQQSWELLPWYVNGTLDEAQAQRIEAHLAQCETCREEYAGQSLLRQHMRDDESVLHAPHASLQKLMAAIDRKENAVVVPPPAQDLKRPRWASRSRWFTIAAVEAACLVMVIGMLSWRVNEERGAARYSTLTSTAAVAVGRAAARIVFVPATSVADLSDLLRLYNARVVAGPSEAGVFTLAFSATMSEADISAAIARLQLDPRVRFAEPAQAARAAGAFE